MRLTRKAKDILLDVLAKRFTSHILLYHTCFEKVPADLGENLHNVSPEILYEQLEWYKKNFTVVSLEEWFQSKRKKGLVAITFDDAYKCVFSEGLKVLEALNLPATVFVIGSTLNGKIFWRDKVRFIESASLETEFIDFMLKNDAKTANLLDRDFYKNSKDRALLDQIGNSVFVEKVDQFLKKKRISQNLRNHCVSKSEELIDHPLLTYGNHTYHHFLLSSLNKEEQFNEISRNHNLIKNIVGSRFLNILSVPYGARESFNRYTIEVCNEFGIEGLLTSSNMVNGITELPTMNGLQVAERYLVPDSFSQMRKFVRKYTHLKFGKFRL